METILEENGVLYRRGKDAEMKTFIVDGVHFPSGEKFQKEVSTDSYASLLILINYWNRGSNEWKYSTS